MRAQLALFPKLKKPRQKPRKLMHVVDAGSEMIQLECIHCRHNTGWIKATETVTQYKRGIPCPKCNTSAKGDSDK